MSSEGKPIEYVYLKVKKDQIRVLDEFQLEELVQNELCSASHKALKFLKYSSSKEEEYAKKKEKLLPPKTKSEE